jgi:hypothetical protein
MNSTDYRNEIDNFEAHYKYDSTYMRELLDHSLEGFAKFNSFLPLSSHMEKLKPEEYWVAKLAAMQVEDCGECLQLNVRMALEAGIARALLHAAIQGGQELPEQLRDVFNYARSVANHEMVDNDLMNRIETRFDKGAMLEFGLCIATAKVFPTIKRAVGYTRTCSLVEIEI